jgi:hypothetical protein
MSTATGIIATAGGIEIEAISDCEWRVIDTRVSPDDAHSLLGFVEKKNGMYESLELSHGFEWFTFPSLHEVAQHFVVRHGGSAVDEHVLAWMSDYATRPVTR